MSPPVNELAPAWPLLIGAAFLEAGGDLLVWMGLRWRPIPLIARAVSLVAYGLVVNPRDPQFGRGTGGCTVTLFVVSQAIAIALFGQGAVRRPLPGSALMVAWLPRREPRQCSRGGVTASLRRRRGPAPRFQSRIGAPDRSTRPSPSAGATASPDRAARGPELSASPARRGQRRAAPP
jgi:hypothetical protein